MSERLGTAVPGEVDSALVGKAGEGSQIARPEAQLAGLLQRITVLANEAADTATALRQAVIDICETIGWPAGQVVMTTPEGDLAPLGPPHFADPSTQYLFAPDVAVEGPSETSPVRRAVSSRRPQWTRDVSHGQRDATSGENRQRRWLAFPVIVDEDVAAVLQFVSLERDDPDADFLETMASIGRQLGVLIERNRARRQLEAINDELERSNQQLERFAYVASHDLQEPLRKIVGFTQLLEQRYGDRLEGEAREFLDIVVDGAYRMRQLINDLLAYSRAGRSQPAMEPIEMSAVVEAALGDLQPAVEESRGTVTVERPLPAVHGNASELRDLLVNLIGNALKYHGDVPPEVTVSTRREPDGWWRLTVADEGIGIDPQHHERIFDVFQRLHGPGQYSGTGIGLAVCRQIADHHGGDIWVDSATGDGARFHVTLPPAPATQANEASDG